MTTPEGTVRVAREGRRGWHFISQAKYDANPDKFTLVDAKGDPLDHDNDGRKGGSKVTKVEGDLSTYTVADLIKHAEENKIDLGGAKKKDDILAAINAAEAAAKAAAEAAARAAAAQNGS